MRSNQYRKLEPSLFHRRLLLLAGCMVALLAVLLGQLVRLAVAQGGELRREAEEQLVDRVLLPTYRGRIVDLHGRVLAADRASYDVAIRYDVITGSWPSQRARQHVVKGVGRNRWNQMSREERDVAIREALPAFDRQVAELWQAVREHGPLTDEELTRRRDEICARVQTTRAAVWERQRRRQESLLDDEEAEDFTFVPRPIREQLAHHVILWGVPDDVAFRLRRLAEDEDRLVQVQDSSQRVYPWLERQVLLDRSTFPRPLRRETPQTVQVIGVADHILGDMRQQVWPSDLQQRPFRHPETGAIDLGGYRDGDHVGASGLEHVFEGHLRGTRGQIELHMDTGRRDRTDAEPGRDLQLTLDIELQSQIQALLAREVGFTVVQPWHQHHALPEGWPLDSAAVVLHVPTGEIRALVTSPTLAMGSVDRPGLPAGRLPPPNRPVEAVYPPGSLVKPLVLTAAVAEGVYQIGETIQCTGHFYPDRVDMARCWIYRPRYDMATHGAITASPAIGQSCNMFFYTLADRLGMARLTDWFGRFGLGRPLDIGLGYAFTGEGGKTVHTGEYGGLLPNPEKLQSALDPSAFRSTSIFLGIGQGRITWTPLHAASAYATVARGGQVLETRLLGSDPRLGRPRQPTDLPLSSALHRTIMDGLRLTLEPHGTGYHISYDDGETEPIIRAPGVAVWAKTGTAQAPPLKLERAEADGDDSSAGGYEHAWFIALVGPAPDGPPLFAIAVIVEYGGSGGRVAGPIADQIIRLLQAQHDLPGGSL